MFYLSVAMHPCIIHLALIMLYKRYDLDLMICVQLFPHPYMLVLNITCKIYIFSKFGFVGIHHIVIDCKPFCAVFAVCGNCGGVCYLTVSVQHQLHVMRLSI